MSARNNKPELIDHIGWDLWRAAELWKQRFSNEMVANGFVWYGEARGNLIQHVGPNGIPQIDLAAKAGMSKQAVQQHLDDLVVDGAVERVSDPHDARKKRVRLTKRGVEAHRVANQIKRNIENDYERLIGGQAMEQLKDGLASLIERQSPTAKK